MTTTCVWQGCDNAARWVGCGASHSWVSPVTQWFGFLLCQSIQSLLPSGGWHSWLVEWGKDSVGRWGLAWQLGRVPSSLLSLSLEYPGVLLSCRLWAVVSSSVWSYLFSFSWICLIISGLLEVTLVAFYIFSDFMLLGDLCCFEVLVVARWGWPCASVSHRDPLFSSLMCLIKTGRYGGESFPFNSRLWFPILRSLAATNGLYYVFFCLFSDYLYVVFIMLLCHIFFHFFLNMSWHIPTSVHEALPHFF